ncbi:Putative hexosyltransferase [Parvularcula bermudensis HTCC2503]|uniref:Putative hexosyltransferase n=1 Tax=Parvularcula bermudensis (strain ATCC BAA-594 / HTCC2503 / KCTC 12087) TaxID=314260 RepID=E0TE35_PARBH|nr:glycosyltransferase family 4 protein [Parvularcula bermudensis]ADM08856.1 Putative hexosyltransferase [Parvularcula bermudensis HTCC2503]
MRIAIVLAPNTTYSPDGASAVVLCAHDAGLYSRHRDDITVIAPQTNTPFSDLSYRPVPTDGGLHAYTKRVKRLLKDQPPDFVEVHQQVKCASHIARQIAPLPVMLVKHSQIKAPKGPVSRIRLSRRIAPLTQIAFVSQFACDHFTAAYPRFVDRAAVAWNGLDTDLYPYAPQAKRKTILFAGRIIANKGALDFAKAMRRTLPHYPDWNAVMIGQPDRGEEAYGEAVRAEIAALGPQGEWLGYRPYPDVMAHFQAAEIVVVPSKWDETFGRVALEAMVTGAALIASRRGGLPEVGGEAATYLDAVTPDHISSAVRALIENTPLRRTQQEAGRRRAVEKFDIRRTVACIDDLREAIVDRT